MEDVNRVTESRQGKIDSISDLEQIDISIVVPAYDEEENIEPLYQEIKEIMNKMSKTFEIIFIDDGSVDGTFEVLKDLYGKDKSVKIIRFRRNFGQTAAISAGFDHAQGNVIVTMDADLQNDPSDIPKLIKKMEEGYDIVSGWRASRKDPFFTRTIPSICANKLISIFSGVHLHDYGCTLKVYSKDVAKNVELYGEMHRFIPALASWMGVSVVELKVNHRARKHGRSKYGISRTLTVFLDLITVKFLLSFATKPIQIFGLLGLVCGIMGTIITLYLSAQRIFHQAALANRPLLLLGILLIVVGVQFISMGLLGELIVRTYHEAQDKPIYVVKEIID